MTDKERGSGEDGGSRVVFDRLAASRSLAISQFDVSDRRPHTPALCCPPFHERRSLAPAHTHTSLRRTARGATPVFRARRNPRQSVTSRSCGAQPDPAPNPGSSPDRTTRFEDGRKEDLGTAYLQTRSHHHQPTYSPFFPLLRRLVYPHQTPKKLFFFSPFFPPKKCPTSKKFLRKFLRRRLPLRRLLLPQPRVP